MTHAHDNAGLSRRRLLKDASGLALSVAFAHSALAAAATGGTSTGGAGQQGAVPRAALEATDVTGRLARYMVTAGTQELPAAVALACKHRILDTLAAMVSGAHLEPGRRAIGFARAQGGVAQATVLTADLRCTAINAALANGMLAHADETDDFEPVTKAHPGSAVVPAALAVAEKDGRSGVELMRAVALGYDVCCRFLLALGPDHVRGTHRSAEGTSSTFGAAGAAASLARLDERGMRHALSYAAQQVSGLWSWTRDTDHVEKAFDFSGMGARNGVTAALMVQSGFTGVDAVLDGEHNMLIALSTQPKPEEMVAGLGSRYFVTETAIKTFSVGYPIQSPTDALLTLRRQHGLAADGVTRIVAKVPPDAVGIVSESAMPDVNMAYVLAVALIEGTVSFEDSHSRERMREPRVREVMSRVQVVGDRALIDPEAPRSGLVELTLRDGRTVSHFTRHAPGTKENPLDTAAVNGKARGLMAPVLGEARTESVIARVNALEREANLREVCALLGSSVR